MRTSAFHFHLWLSHCSWFRIKQKKMTTMMLSTPMKEAEGIMQDWKTVFPDFTTLEGSCLFIKKLIAVSLSSITYIRRIFPEEAYGERNLNGLKIKILSADSGIKSVTKFINLIRSCYDAVEKKYLQQLSVGICYNPDNMDEVVEAYNLVFRYTDNECAVTCHNARTLLQSDPTVQATFLMLKSICAISDLLGDLPKNAYISVKLLYYDDVTPPDYEPEGFAPSSNIKFTFTGKTMNLQLGKVNSERYSYKLLLKTTASKQSLSQFNPEEPMMNCTETMSGSEKVSNENKSSQKIQDSQSGKVLAPGKSNKSLQCPCEHKCIDDSDMITCLSCERVQHKSCYGLRTSENIPIVFYCVECILHNSDGHVPLDLVYTYRGKERQEFCNMRRALYYCFSHKTFTNLNFEKHMGCNKPAAKVLLERLEFEGFITKGSGKNKYIVEESVFMDSCELSRYFPLNENNENEEQLEENADHEMDQVPSPSLEHENISQDYSTSLLENSINKVKALSLNNRSPKEVVRSTRKRKSSCKAISPAASDELFQSQKKLRTRRRI